MSRAALQPALTEKDWMRQVVDLARLLGWRVAHFRPAMTKHGWVTPVAADGKGFPDLLCTRRGRLLVAELKSDSGKIAPEQEVWLEAFRAAGAEVFVWRPADADEVLGILRRKATAA
jgi:hypothetical protein